MDSLHHLTRRYGEMTKWVLDSEAAEDNRSWVFPAELDGETGIVRVKNLGWLLKHSSEVLHPMQGMAFSVRGWRYGQRIGIPPVGPLTVERFNPILFANLVDGRTYAAQWQDVTVLHDWLDRPSFRGYHIQWDVKPSTYLHCMVGDSEYNGIDLNTRMPVF